MASSSSNFKGRDEAKKQKALEEARKAGTAPAEKDEDGNDINPHIPQYIAQAPWYLNKTSPSLKHQKSSLKKSDVAGLDEWYARGARVATAATKFRKGACTNCGAMTHTAKTCCERPRKIGAKFTGQDIQPDEVVVDVALDYDGKRDRWNGYDTAEHMQLLEVYNKADEERRRIRKQKELNSMVTEAEKAQDGQGEAVAQNGKSAEVMLDIEKEDVDLLSDDEEDEEKQDFVNDGVEVVGAKRDARTRTTVRNLRIREDTAKYLRNLDPNSAHYDPKSRSMRENPTPSEDPNNATFVGDSFARASGDVQKFHSMMSYAFEAQAKGQELHPQAAPSQAELLHRDYKQKRETLTQMQRELLFSRYGGKEHLADDVPKSLLLAQTEEYVEYTPDGSLLQGSHKSIPRSKYEEDVFIQNHTSVWGSYWEDFRWGYACCHSMVKNSYCIGKAGKGPDPRLTSGKEEEREQEDSRSGEASPPTEMSPKQSRTTDKKAKKDGELDKDKLKKALRDEEERSRSTEKDERKRGYNSLRAGNTEPTEEEMQAYFLKKQRFDDPMRHM